MVRELAIFLFLLFFKCVFFLFNRFPLKEKKITFVVSFGDNSKYVLEEIQKQRIQVEVVVLCKRKSMDLFKEYKDIQLIPFKETNMISIFWLQSIYHLATSRYIIVDNYYGFLSVVNFKEGVRCIQLWHASGALKKFGLEDKTIKKRSPKAKQRFLQVYKKYHKVVVGSDIMAASFIKSFDLIKGQILTTGIPRTDFFFNEKAIQSARRKLAMQYPAINDKKVILYAPTYRDHELDQFILKLDIAKMAKKLGNNYILFLRLHPAIKNTDDFSQQFPDFIIDVSSNRYDLNELLAVADYLITDYSSIVYEFSLLQKPIIFYAYDLEEYSQYRGLIEDFENRLPGPIAKDTDMIIELIHINQFDLERIHFYSKTWNKYSLGHSSYNLVQYMFPE